MASAMEFARTILAAKLVDRRELKTVLARVGETATFERLCEELVKDGLLTPWQIQQIAQGNHHSLVIDGRYRMIDRLGQGSMGRVYRALDIKLDRPVVVKIPKAELLRDPKIQARFRREVVINGRLEHPNIVRAFDVGKISNALYMVMEFVDGADLNAIIMRDGPLPTAKVVDVIRQVAQALRYAHSQKVVHRDLKPSNILIRADGQVKILDMGLARLDRHVSAGSNDGRSAVTVDGELFGSVQYMSPEQATDTHLADIRSDIYSLGCAVYKMLTGEPPFSGGSPLDMIRRHATEEPEPIDPIDPDLNGMLFRMLAKLPEDRYQKPTEILDELRQWGRKYISADALLAIEAESTRLTPAAFDGSGTRPTPPSISDPSTVPSRELLGGKLATLVSPGAVCVVINQCSRRMAMADMVNAGRLSNLVEICLDWFLKPPDIKELLTACPKPIIVSCRRTQDGGQWHASESDRLQILRKGVEAGAHFVEIESDVVHRFPREGDALRIVSYTNLAGVPANLAEIIQRISKKDADVIKVAVPVHSPVELRLLQSCLRSFRTPTVIHGTEGTGTTLNVLGPRLSLPWTYAALENNEASPGVPSVFDLADVFEIRSLDRQTPLFIVLGSEKWRRLTARVLNFGFKLVNKPVRCLPLAAGRADSLHRLATDLNLAGIISEETAREDLAELASQPERIVQLAGVADTIVFRDDGIAGGHSLVNAVVDRLREALKIVRNEQREWNTRRILLVGASHLSRALAHSLVDAGAQLYVTDMDDFRARRAAKEAGAGRIPFAELAGANVDAIVLAPTGYPSRWPATLLDIGEGLLRDERIFLDLSAFPQSTPLMDHARSRGMQVLEPADLYLQTISEAIRLATGRETTPFELCRAVEGFEFDRADPKIE